MIDPEKYPFFDPVTGEPRVWFWRESGDYEFYDNRGFHPRTGEQLKVITREDVAKWKQEREAVERTKGDEQLRNEHARRERTEQEEQRRQKAPEDQGKFTEGRGQSSPPFDTDNPGQRPAPQPQQILFDHNGSLMSWQRDGPNVRVVYLKPRPGVGAVGIRPGTVLFAGQWSDQRLVGNAHVFATGCPPFPYRVSGGYVSNDVIVMDGAAPVVDPSTCTVLRYTLKSANAHPSYSLIRVGD
jgi:hypothetical protein